MEQAKMQCEIVQAVRREGLYFSSLVTNDATLAGGREVKPGASSSGLLTNQGRVTDMMKVMIEKAIKAIEPIRPTCPVKSAAFLTSAGASYRR